jgi:hypothetical protein
MARSAGLGVMGKDKPLGGKAAAAKEAKDKAAVAAAKEKGVEMCVEYSLFFAVSGTISRLNTYCYVLSRRHLYNFQK